MSLLVVLMQNLCCGISPKEKHAKLWILVSTQPYSIQPRDKRNTHLKKRVGLPDMESHGSGEQCFNPAFIHAAAVPELAMLDKCGKICAVARGDGTVDVVDIDSELSSFKSKPRNPNPSASRSTTTSVDRKEGKRIHLDTSLGGHSAAASCVYFSLFGEKGRYIISGGNDAFVKVWDWSKDLDAGEGNVLRQNISLRKKVNWICSTPSDSENLVVCDTSKIVKNKVPNSTTDHTQQVGLHRDGSKSSSIWH